MYWGKFSSTIKPPPHPFEMVLKRKDIEKCTHILNLTRKKEADCIKILLPGILNFHISLRKRGGIHM